MSQLMQFADELSVVMLSDFHDRIIHLTVAHHLSKYQVHMKRFLDANCPQAEFKVRNIVLVLDPVRKSHSSPKWLGLFEVVVISAGGAVMLTAQGGDFALAPPERKFVPHQLVQLEEAPKPPADYYKFNHILAHWRNGKAMQFKVHGHGFPSCEDTCEQTRAFLNPELQMGYASTLENLRTANATRNAVGAPPQRAKEQRPCHG
ncbi:hypothetical protein H4S08_004440 [Coemansia sp. RSA 1365]|nr:hypothetical protein H4S08_004440 [Coemansia sp. RSA 1365]